MPFLEGAESGKQQQPCRSRRLEGASSWMLRVVVRCDMRRVLPLAGQLRQPRVFCPSLAGHQPHNPRRWCPASVPIRPLEPSREKCASASTNPAVPELWDVAVDSDNCRQFGQLSCQPRDIEAQFHRAAYASLASTFVPLRKPILLPIASWVLGMIIYLFFFVSSSESST